MIGKFNIYDSEFSQCKTVFKGPSDLEMNFGRNSVKDVGEVFNIYDSRGSVLKILNLPENTPVELVAEVVDIIRKNPESSRSVKERIIRKSQLFEWLGASANLVTIATPIIAFALGKLTSP